ncbi:tetratricopeptide repeat protein [Streptomyces sp. SAS_270]|uniref:tetratricopeptide repeat protein n=1 Tax=Streptomyces sp. SAS_270 TaxID=3412748 RepID=UPI00403C9A82
MAQEHSIAAHRIGQLNQHYHAPAPTPLRWPQVIGDIPAQPTAFQPRTAVREAIDRARASSGTVVLTQVLRGGGGMGKTQLAAAYARQAQADGTDLVIWASSADTRTPLDLYARVARRLNLGTGEQDTEQDARALLAWLRTTDRSWLIVLDDIVPEAMTSWWPPDGRRGRVLATTRRNDAVLRGGKRAVLEIDRYTPAEANTFLRDHLAASAKPHLLDDRTDQVVAELDRMPLALAFAAAYITQQNITTTAYLDRYRQLRLDAVLPAWADAEEYGREVSLSLLLALEAAQHQHPLAMAQPALRLAACLDPAGQPHALWHTPAVLTHLAPPGTPPDQAAALVDDVLRLLDRYGLLTDDAHQEPHAVRLHALTARAAREDTPDTDLRTTQLAAADALTALWPNADHTQPGLRTALRDNTETLARHTRDLLWESGRHPLLYWNAAAAADMGLVNNAVQQWECLVAETQTHQPEHPDTLTARASLAASYGQAGRTAEAITIQEQVLTDTERIQGAEHPDTLTTRANLAASYWQAGRTAEAITIQEQVLTDTERIQGAEHPDTWH